MRPACLIFLLLYSSHVFALVMERFSLEELAREADLVILGKVIGKQSRYDSSRRIVTDVYFMIDDIVAGKASGTTVVVTTPGGSVDGKGQLVFGAPVFEIGEEAVLFLRTPQETVYGLRHSLVGLTQGVFFVERSPDRPTRAVQRLDGVMFLHATPVGMAYQLKELYERVRSARTVVVDQ